MLKNELDKNDRKARTSANVWSGQAISETNEKMNPFSSYPAEMATNLIKQWSLRGLSDDLLPDTKLLTTLLDVGYQASLLREEDDPVRCRILFANPEYLETLTPDGPRPHVLEFSEPATLTAHNLRKLSAAAGYYRAMLAVRVDSESQLVIWGLVVTGTEWVNRVEGTRFDGVPLPPNLVIHAVGPGHLVAASGYSRVLETQHGQLLTDGFDPFRSTWLSERFVNVRASLLQRLPQPQQGHPELCQSFVRDVAQSVVRRTLRLVRNRRHGGMLVFLPDGSHQDGTIQNWLRFRVEFRSDDSTMLYRRLMLRLMTRVRDVGKAMQLSVITWDDYQQLRDAELRRLDDDLVEFSHFLADLMNIDGSLVLDHSFRLIGFGGEILGNTPAQRIHRALDIEANQSTVEPADSSGTRHRSAYRLVEGINNAIAVVVSQDGDVRFVAYHNEKLTYWPYLP